MAYMGNTNSKSKVLILTASQEFTGKIDKVQAICNYNQTASLAVFQQGDINSTSVISGSDSSRGHIGVASGTVIEGPATKVRVSDDADSGDFIVYYRT